MAAALIATVGSPRERWAPSYADAARIGPENAAPSTNGGNT